MLTSFFFFNDTATTEIYTLSLHDALPILQLSNSAFFSQGRTIADLRTAVTRLGLATLRDLDRKSTRLNSSHSQISYAVFCLKKKKQDIMAVQDHVPAIPNRLTSVTLCDDD